MHPPRGARRPGRRAGAPGESRAAILDAARELFANRGFQQTTTRAIAAAAGVDIALIHYFFGSKDKLFAAAIELPVAPAELEDALKRGAGSRGERLARFFLEGVFSTRSHAVAAMIRAAVSDPGCVPALRKLLHQTVIGAVASSLPGPRATLQAELVGAHLVGLFICRYLVKVEPLASLSTEEVVRFVAPAIDALTGG
jgi:AcrR family transcriptional regulator